jgi:hypothetical protein
MGNVFVVKFLNFLPLSVRPMVKSKIAAKSLENEAEKRNAL